MVEMLMVVVLNAAMILQALTKLELIKLAWSTRAPENQALGVRSYIPGIYLSLCCNCQLLAFAP